MTTTTQRHPHCPHCNERNATLVVSGTHILGCVRCYSARLLLGPRAAQSATAGYSLRRVA